MPEWAHELSTIAVLGFAVGWLAWRLLHPGRAVTCSSCTAAVPMGDGRGRRSARLKILD